MGNDGHYGFRPVYSCVSQIVTVSQGIADSLNEGVRTVTIIIIYFSKISDLVPHDNLLTNIAANRVDLREIVWLRNFS